MRTVAAIAGVTALVGTAVFYLWSGDGSETTHSAPQADEPTTTPDAEDVSPMRQAKSLQTVSHPEAPSLAPRRRVALSSPERREGESEEEHARRVGFINSFEGFVERAGISDEQREQVISIMADMQQESILAWEEFGRLRDGKRLSLVAMDKTLGKELFNRLRDVLPREQLLAFRRTASIDLPLHYAQIRPIDIEMPESE